MGRGRLLLAMTGMKINLKQTLEIGEAVSDPRIRLQARAIANDCYKYIMDLTTNGVVITDDIELEIYLFTPSSYSNL